jgi:peptidoglycan hydrolase-like protein with peptidoglycan-binding domain
VRGIVEGVRRPLWAAVLVAALLLFAATVASADRGNATATASSEEVVERGDRGQAVRSIQTALGIPADGVFGPQTERAVRRFQRRNGLVVDGVVGPQTRSALGLAPFSGSSVRSRSVSVPRVLQRIADCESGGNPSAVSPDGTYRGKYQFTRETWRRLGGEGDPADAPEWLQDRMALKLYRQSGTEPWPGCS